MFTIKLKGTLNSKFAAHVPVIRRWKLVWERREFGSRVDQIDQSVPLQFTDWNILPVGGKKVKIVGDWEVQVKRIVGGTENLIALSLFWNGIEVPGTYKAIPLPDLSQVVPSNAFDWKADVWKGVSLDLKASLVWEP